MTKFSVVVITKDEALSLPKLALSLKPFMERGGSVVCMDTGSVDGTPDLARSLGFSVTEVGDQYTHTITEAQAKAINDLMVDGEEPIISVGDRVFDFAAARNAAAALSPTDWVLMPDADEVVEINIDALETLMTDDRGFLSCTIQAGTTKWTTARCYNRAKMHWEGMTHEGLFGNPGAQGTEGGFVNFLSLTHFQLPKLERPTRIKSLALNWYENRTPRSIHYFGRELLYRERFKTAISVLATHVAIPDTYDRSESWVYIGDAYRALKQPIQAFESWFSAYLADTTRRIGLLRIAEHAWSTADWQVCASMALAALQIPYLNRYVEDMNEYGALPHEYLYPALWRLGRKKESAEHYGKALALNPSNPKTIADNRWYYDPLVSIVIPHLPTLNRDVRLSECIDAITLNAGYDNYEIVVERDSWDDRQGAPKTLKKGVERSNGELVMFLGCDTLPQKDFLKNAVDKLRTFDGMVGLVGLNDGVHGDALATHWLASKSILPLIGGEFFHTGYHHCFCDNELTERTKKLGLFAWAEDAKLTHNHPIFTGEKMDEVYTIAYDREKQLEDAALYEFRRKSFPSQLPKVHPSIAILPRLPKGWERMRVLNVGIGPGNSGLASQLPSIPFHSLTHLEVFEPYIEAAKKVEWAANTVHFVKDDMRHYDVSQYDLILCFDVLEHIPKEDALAFIEKCKAANVKLVVFGPLEPALMNHRHGVEDGNPAQEHVSIWTEQDFKDLGFITELLPDFHEEHGEKFPAVWALSGV